MQGTGCTETFLALRMSTCSLMYFSKEQGNQCACRRRRVPMQPCNSAGSALGTPKWRAIEAARACFIVRSALSGRFATDVGKIMQSPDAPSQTREVTHQNLSEMAPGCRRARAYPAVHAYQIACVLVLALFDLGESRAVAYSIVLRICVLATIVPLAGPPAILTNCARCTALSPQSSKRAIQPQKPCRR
jgi:hypothetical protein